jgi:hypothetical protein
MLLKVLRSASHRKIEEALYISIEHFLESLEAPQQKRELP